MQTRKVDVAVLGAGTAGLTARRAAAKQGASAVLIDPGPYGTKCARVGCMPSKLLIAAAEAAHTIRRAETFGLRAQMIVDGKAVLERVRKERDRFVGGVLESIDSLRKEGALLEGAGRFLGPDRIEVDGYGQVQARAVVIATGTRPVVPLAYQAAGDRLMTYEQIFEIDAMPERLLVVGTGIIGLELGQALTRLGVRTTLLGKFSDLGPLTDPKMKAEAHHVLSGDVNGWRPVLHEAADEGRIAGENAARYPSVMAKPRTVALQIVFTDPQMAVIGKPWSEMRCEDDRVGVIDFENQGRSRVMAVNRGKARIYGERASGLILGAEMFGPGV